MRVDASCGVADAKAKDGCPDACHQDDRLRFADRRRCAGMCAACRRTRTKAAVLGIHGQGKCHLVLFQERANEQGEGKTKKLNATSLFEDEEHVLSILSSLFTHLASDTPERIRLIAKFVENEYEKVERLLELREVAENRLKPVEKDIAREKKVMQANGEEVDEDVEAEWYLRRSESGLSALQAADYVLAWVCMEDDGVSRSVHCRTQGPEERGIDADLRLWRMPGPCLAGRIRRSLAWSRF